MSKNGNGQESQEVYLRVKGSGEAAALQTWKATLKNATSSVEEAGTVLGAQSGI